MPRYAVKKVDGEGKVIKNFSKWKKDNPESIYFDSKLEFNFYKELQRRRIKFDYQVSYTLQEGFKWEEWCVRKKNGTQVLDWHISKIQPITWTVDFYLTDYDILLEAKGRPNDAFPNKLKQTKRLLFDMNSSTKIVVLHSIKELTEFLNKGLVNGE
jgi:hypothetical protein